jgi:hypothetical protein
MARQSHRPIPAWTRKPGIVDINHQLVIPLDNTNRIPATTSPKPTISATAAGRDLRRITAMKAAIGAITKPSPTT